MNIRSGKTSVLRAAMALIVAPIVAGCGGDGSPAASESAAIVVSASDQIPDVATFKGGNARLNVMPGPGPQGRPETLWDVDIPDPSDAEPIVVNGTVIVATRGGLLVGIDAATGNPAWRPVALAAGVRSNPASDGEYLYLVTDDGVLRAISLEDRRERWHAQGPFLPEARIAVAVGLVIAGGPGVLAAVSATTGDQVWRVPAEASMRLAVDGELAYASGNGSPMMTVVDVARGVAVRTDNIGGADVATAALDGGGVVVGRREDAAGPENGVVTLKPDGTPGWSSGTSRDSRLENVAVAGDRVVLVTDLPLAAEVVNRSTGRQEWFWEEQGGSDEGEMLGGGSVVGSVLYLVGTTKGLIALDIERHRELWSAPLDGRRRDTALVVTGGLVIATIPSDNGTGRVVALADPADPRLAALRAAPVATPTAKPASAPAFFKVIDAGTTLEDDAFPMGTALGPDGTLYVTDAQNSRILIRTADANDTWWDGYRTSQGDFAFKDPSVAVSPDGSLIAVAEAGNHRVLLFDSHREFLRSIGRLGDGPEQFVRPIVTIDPRNRLWVVDGSNDNVQLFAPDGTYLNTFAGTGEAEDRLHGPGGASYREDTDELYVADFDNDRISVFNEDGWVRNYEARPDDGLRFVGVNNVELDAAGRMYVVDTTNRIFILGADGHHIDTIPSVLPDPVGRVDVPGFSLDTHGRIYLSDVNEKRIVVLQLLAPDWPPGG